MATWQFDGTVSYQSGKRVAYAAVSLGQADGPSVAGVFRTETDLSGRFEAMLREGPSNGNFVARAFDSWRNRAGDWVPVARNGGNVLTADLVLPWEQADVCAANGQWYNSAAPFVDAILRGLERLGSQHQVLALRLQPVREDGTVYDSYPSDPAIERMFTQFMEEAGQSSHHPHAAMDFARRVSDCLLRMGFAKKFDERIDVFRFALQGIYARPKDDRKMHLRNLLKTLSMSLRRPFVPGNGAVVELESVTATVAMVLYAGALLSLGRTDLKLSKETTKTSQLIFQLSVPPGS